MRFKTKLPKQTKQLAAFLARSLANDQILRISGSAIVLALSGDLGAGKTSFTQGFVRALGVRGKVTSPTFILMQRFKIHDLRFKNAYHVDCYRIDNSNELTKLGIKKILRNPENVVLIEWAEKITKFLPSDAVWVKFEHGEKPTERIISVNQRCRPR